VKEQTGWTRNKEKIPNVNPVKVPVEEGIV
jgi:hypothetical protein